jgi:hypothetical protein
VKTQCLSRVALLAALAAGSALPLLADDAKPAAKPYATDLSAMPVGKLPDELFVLNGKFEIAEVAGNKVLMLPGNPVNSFGVLFGAEEQQAMEVSARIQGTAVGKMFPEFGIGANDSSGWKVWLMPGQNALALRVKEVDEVARVPYAGWESGSWTQFRLRVSKQAEDKWLVQGKAWPDGKPEPAEWMLSHTAPVAPPGGRASVWGHPYSGTPIHFDDLATTPLK